MQLFRGSDRMRVFLLVGLLIAVGTLPNAAQAQDVLVLANGDRLTGTLVSISDGTWTFEHVGGALTIAAADVVTFAPAERIGIRLADGTIAAGQITVTGGTMRFTTDDGTARSVTPADLAAIGSADDLQALRPVAIGFLSPFGKFWRASIGAGLANTTGNSRSRGFNGDLKVERKTSKDRLSFNLGGATEWSSVRDGDTGQFPDLTKTVEKYYGSGRLDVYVSSAFFLFGGTLQEIDKFQGLDLRSNYNAGAGYQVIDTDPTDLRFDLSAGLRVENFTPGAGDTTISTPIASAGGRLEQQLGPLTLDWSLRWTPAIENIKDYRFLSDAGLSTELFQGLGFRIGSRNEFNNNPATIQGTAGPYVLAKHDWLLTFNLTYTLGG
jgi:putative salt-induced outer membrane protein YdiY